MDPQRWPTEWLRGVLELCVLGVLTQGRTYGYAIAQELERAGLGTVKGGTLYPLLARLEADGLLVASWQAGDGGPGRKYFELTAAGRAEALARAELWRRFVTATGDLLPATGDLLPATGEN
jgi:PadR family transcriptional regulator PadR